MEAPPEVLAMYSLERLTPADCSPTGAQPVTATAK